MNSNKNFFILLTILGLNLYSLNLCHKTALCALVFTSIMLIVKMMHDKFSTKKTFTSLGLLSLINIIANNTNYYIGNHMVSNLVAISMLAVFLSAFLGNLITKKLGLENALGNIFYFSTCALVDGVVMATFLLGNFSISKAASISLTETTYKIFYSLIVVALLHLIKNLSIRQIFLGNNTVN